VVVDPPVDRVTVCVVVDSPLVELTVCVVVEADGSARSCVKEMPKNPNKPPERPPLDRGARLGALAALAGWSGVRTCNEKSSDSSPYSSYAGS
jgi:hypothetical protein